MPRRAAKSKFHNDAADLVHLPSCPAEKAIADEYDAMDIGDPEAEYDGSAIHPPDYKSLARSVPRTAPKDFVARLKELEAVENKHAGTQNMISLIHRLSRQKWATFTLRYDEGAVRGDSEHPAMENLYAETVLTRWEMAEDMLQFAILHQEVVDNYGEDYELYWIKSGTTGQISARMVAFMEDVYKRGERVYRGCKPQELVVREWHERGTWETLSASHVVPQEDLAEEREEGEPYPMRIW
ncbi:hypothetical protein LTR36_001841 [Oleoguttula mirabilis]|uniref:Uncharacterized protein n=1 Tax=Oleoguttula mirabilis TaxID=1507867 RepID=A0AAV9JNT3_9PEZI|nr:hypothetical protein LTR36_001841 [Oleoguttula mirabilis]